MWCFVSAVLYCRVSALIELGVVVYTVEQGLNKEVDFICECMHAPRYQYLQVNKKFHKFERIYRDCIKRSRDKTRIHCIPHDAPGT